MKGSYQLQNFTEIKETEVTRLKSQVDLFFDKEFELFKGAGLKDGMQIIECGSGPGFLIRNILEKLPECKATALEIDPFLFSVLSENSVSGGKQLYKAVNGSIYDTGLPADSFDFAVTRLVIEHLDEPLKAIHELNRILKPGGILVIVSNDFSYHLLTYPVISELDEMYEAYCKSRFSEGGNPLIGRQLPVYLQNSGFDQINFQIAAAHSKLSGDDVFLKAENVNISKRLVESGFLKRETLANLVEKWFQMTKDPNHVFYRQLFVVSAKKSLDYKSLLYSVTLEQELRGNIHIEVKSEAPSDVLESQKRKFNELMNKRNLKSVPFNSAAVTDHSSVSQPGIINLNEPGNNGHTMAKVDMGTIEAGILAIWKESLKKDSISADDNYFEIGGDSVLIPEIVQRLADEYNIKVRILDIFDNPSVRLLAGFIGRNGNR